MPSIFRHSKTLALCLGIVLLSGPIHARTPAEQETLELQALGSWDGYVETIGHGLAVANVELCSRRAWRPGFTVHDLYQYRAESRPAAIRAHDVGVRPSVLALAEGGPAARAGLAVGDVLISADGTPFPSAQPARRASSGGMEEALIVMEAAFADGAAILDVQRRAERLSISVRADRGCVSRFQMVASRASNALADGVHVQITTRLIRSVRNADEVAAVLAHEFAHNVLGHPAILAEARRTRRPNVARLQRDSELEADRLSIYLVDRAGYDPNGAITFWRRYGREGLNFLTSPTHPRWQRRVEVMGTELSTLRRLKLQEGDPMPPLLRDRQTDDPIT